jgi:hypothetical protein
VKVGAFSDDALILSKEYLLYPGLTQDPPPKTIREIMFGWVGYDPTIYQDPTLVSYFANTLVAG